MQAPKLDSRALVVTRAAVARAKRQVNLHPTDPERREALFAAEAKYKEVMTAEFIRSMVSTAPPLSPEARARLAALLAPARAKRRTA